MIRLSYCARNWTFAAPDVAIGTLSRYCLKAYGIGRFRRAASKTGVEPRFTLQFDTFEISASRQPRPAQVKCDRGISSIIFGDESRNRRGFAFSRLCIPGAGHPTSAFVGNVVSSHTQSVRVFRIGFLITAGRRTVSPLLNVTGSFKSSTFTCAFPSNMIQTTG